MLSIPILFNFKPKMGLKNHRMPVPQKALPRKREIHGNIKVRSINWLSKQGTCSRAWDKFRLL